MTRRPGGVRLVVVGKGGVGKSTLSALLARTWARQGSRVVAIDADEQRNLASSLGLTPAEADGVVAISENADYVEEKTGARPSEGSGGMLRLNPDTTDVVERLSVSAPDGVSLLVMGGVTRAGGGCLCPQNSLLSAAIADMRLRTGDVVVMDTHAGVEHFGRSLARGFERAVVVVVPSVNAVHVGLETARLSRELGIGSIDLVINQCRSDADVERTLGYVDRLGGFDFTSATSLPHDDAALGGEPSVDRLLDTALGVAVRTLCRELTAPPLDTEAASCAS